MKNNWVWKNKRNEKKKKQSLRRVGDGVSRDEKEDKNKRKRMLKCGVGVGKKINKKGVQLERKVGKEKGERWGKE